MKPSWLLSMCEPSDLEVRDDDFIKLNDETFQYLEEIMSTPNLRATSVPSLRN